MRIPTDKDFSSLNLAQAVLLLAYEWAMAAPEMPADLPDAADALPHDEHGEDTAAVARAPMEVSLAPGVYPTYPTCHTPMIPTGTSHTSHFAHVSDAIHD